MTAGATIAVHGLTASVRRARRVRWCVDRRDACPRKIEPGQLYVRSVMFPNHDVYSYIDPVTRRPLRRPMPHDLCLTCASNYDDIGEIAREALAAVERGVQ